MKSATKVVHAGVNPDPSTGAIMTPIYQTSTYVQASPGEHKGYEYGRATNPTRDALQASIAALENGTHGLVFGSGMAATDAVARMLKPGDEMIVTNDLYGGTFRIFSRVFAQYGIKFTYVPMHDLVEVEKAITGKTKMIWVETPTNPTLQIVDIEELAKIAKIKGVILAVDNTFASPMLQNPLDLGADIVMHSVTKYINGHSDVMMGALVSKNEDIHAQLAFFQNACGAIPGPQDCFLVLRGIKTLAIRMKQHCENGKVIANYLASHPKVEKVNWPGFLTHPGHEIAKRQMKDFGGMMSFAIKGDLKTATEFVSNTRLFALAESLGGVESLIGLPASMSHAAIPLEERLKVGVTDNLIRVSVGIEDADDLIQDLEAAFAKV
jgi:cystathionine gamma-lyase